MSTPCYLFDIDGTLADISHRLHHIQKEPKDWDAFFEDCHSDARIDAICTLASHLSVAVRRMVSAHAIVFVTGRSDRVREKTENWLLAHTGLRGPLYMRADGDHRPDHIVKAELLDQIIKDGFTPALAFEDRDQVVKMWRERGVPCAQVAEGNF